MKRINKQPPYQQVKDLLKKDVLKLDEGDLFPSERELETKYPVCRSTISKAISSLVAEGLLHRIQGKGTFVADFNKKIKTLNIGLVLARRIAELSKEAVNPNSLHEIESACKNYGHHLLFSITEERLRKNRELIEKVDGLILCDSINNNFIKNLNRSLPVVLLNYRIDGESVSSIMADNVTGAYRAAKYLLELGHKSIGFIYGPFIAPSFRERLSGYKKALSEHKIRFKKTLLQEGGHYIQDGYRAMKTLLSLPQVPAAVFASNDVMALGAMKAIKDKGMNIPEEISIVGFDDSEFAAYVSPPLTTVRVDNKAMVGKAVKSLMEKIDRNNVEPKEIIVPTELIVRESCKCLGDTSCRFF